jgi:hypothetical protein
MRRKREPAEANDSEVARRPVDDRGVSDLSLT